MYVSKARAREHLNALFDEVRRGGEVIILESGVPIAKLVAINSRDAESPGEDIDIFDHNRKYGPLTNQWFAEVHATFLSDSSEEYIVIDGFHLNREKARQIAAGLLEASRGIKLAGLKIKDLVNEGRF